MATGSYAHTLVTTPVMGLGGVVFLWVESSIVHTIDTRFDTAIML